MTRKGAGGVRGVLLDMDGVLTAAWNGAEPDRPIAGAAASLEWLRRAGLPFRVLTNTTSQSRRALAGLLRRSGMDVADGEVLTATLAAAAHLRRRHPGARVLVLGDAIAEDLSGVDLVGPDEDPQVVLLSGVNDRLTFDLLNHAFRAMLAGAAFVAAHRNLSWVTAEGECLDSGVLLPGLEAAVGRPAAVTGKPAPEFFRSGLDALDLPPSQVVMVGDDVRTDVLAAQALGMTGVLVRTGKFRPEAVEAAAAEGRPDHVLDSVAGLPGWLAGRTG